MTAALVLLTLVAAGGEEVRVQPRPAAQGDLVVVAATGEPLSVTLGAGGAEPARGVAEARPGTARETRAVFFRLGDESLALLGIDAEAMPGTRRLAVHWADRDVAVDLPVKTKKFPTEKLRVEPKYVEPPPDVIARITAEKERLDALWRRAEDKPLWHEPFVRPVDKLPSSSFGLQRVFNGQRRSPHNGVDFKAAEGVPVAAANAGRVALSGDLYFTGNTVILDHGLGLYTVYAHLSQIGVAVGERIAAGAVIGHVGATGRATGPHLHWGARLLEARIDPMQLLELGKEADGTHRRQDL